jgi:acyl dehydratase
VAPVGTSVRHEVVAHNTATASANKIHDDEVARRYGFGGGLVPGVDVYAYMTRAPAEAWGLDWLGGGAMRARFLSPVYEGRRVTVVGAVEDGGATEMAIELRDEGGTLCATGEASLPGPGADDEAPSPAAWPVVPTAEDPPEASPDALRPGTALAVPTHAFHADRAGEYLADVRETLPLYGDEAVAHPAWLLRGANHVLGSNVRLGPWIHVGSDVRHHSLVRDGETVDTRAIVTREWERKGHRFVELDVAIVADGDRLAARVVHTAIYRPRQVTEP